jgi:hypothetical protein
MKKLISLFALSLGFIGACSENAEPRLTQETFCREWANQACSATVVSACQAENAEACRLSQQAACQALLPEGFVDDTVNEQACLNAVGAAYEDADLNATELETVLRLGEPCNRLVRGGRSAGDRCESTFECDAASGFTCVIKGTDSDGTCQKPREMEPGMGCEALQDTCSAEFYCNGDNCIAAEEVGSACASQLQCGSTGYCAADGTCAERFAVREACSADYECASGTCFTFDAERICVDSIRLSPSEPLCDALR